MFLNWWGNQRVFKFASNQKESSETSRLTVIQAALLQWIFFYFLSSIRQAGHVSVPLPSNSKGLIYSLFCLWSAHTHCQTQRVCVYCSEQDCLQDSSPWWNVCVFRRWPRHLEGCRHTDVDLARIDALQHCVCVCVCVSFYLGACSAPPTLILPRWLSTRQSSSPSAALWRSLWHPVCVCVWPTSSLSPAPRLISPLLRLPALCLNTSHFWVKRDKKQRQLFCFEQKAKAKNLFHPARLFWLWLNSVLNGRQASKLDLIAATFWLQEFSQNEKKKVHYPWGVIRILKKLVMCHDWRVINL